MSFLRFLGGKLRITVIAVLMVVMLLYFAVVAGAVILAVLVVGGLVAVAWSVLNGGRYRR